MGSAKPLQLYQTETLAECSIVNGAHSNETGSQAKPTRWSGTRHIAIPVSPVARGTKYGAASGRRVATAVEKSLGGTGRGHVPDRLGDRPCLGRWRQWRRCRGHGRRRRGRRGRGFDHRHGCGGRQPLRRPRRRRRRRCGYNEWRRWWQRPRGGWRRRWHRRFRTWRQWRQWWPWRQRLRWRWWRWRRRGIVFRRQHNDDDCPDRRRWRRGRYGRLHQQPSFWEWRGWRRRWLRRDRQQRNFHNFWLRQRCRCRRRDWRKWGRR